MATAVTPGMAQVAATLAATQIAPGTPGAPPSQPWNIHPPGHVSTNGHPLMINSPEAIAHNPAGVAAGRAAWGTPPAQNGSVYGPAPGVPMPGQHQDYFSPAFTQRMMGQTPTPPAYQRPMPAEHMDNFSPAFMQRMVGQTPTPPPYQRPMPTEHQDNFSDAFMSRMVNGGVAPGQWRPPGDAAFGAMNHGQQADWQPRPPQTQTFAAGSKGALQSMMGFQGPANRLGH